MDTIYSTRDSPYRWQLARRPKPSKGHGSKKDGEEKEVDLEVYKEKDVDISPKSISEVGPVSLNVYWEVVGVGSGRGRVN